MSEAAAAAAADMLAEAGATDAQEEPEGAVGQETEAEDMDELDPEIPDELAALVEDDEPDFTEAEEEEPDYQPEDDEEYDDPAVKAERNKRIALEKKVRWLEEQKLKNDRKRWVEKDARFFPWANAEDIASRASSRKQFAQMMKAENERIKKLPAVQKILAERGKTEIKEQWGTPSAGPGLVPTQASDAKTQMERARATGSLKEQIKGLFDSGKIENL